MRVRLLLWTACAATACGDAIRVVKQTVALQEAFFRQIDRRSPTPQMRDRLRALARSGAGDSVQSLVAQGLVRLDDATLIRRMELMSVMLEESDVPICAAIARGTPGSGQMTLAMAELEGPDLEDWVGVLVEAQIAQLEQREIMFMRPGTAVQSIQTAIAALPDSDETRMDDVLGRFATASDADACWAGRALFGQGAALQDPERRAFARALVQP
jgi:hypothetical protein